MRSEFSFQGVDHSTVGASNDRRKAKERINQQIVDSKKKHGPYIPLPVKPPWQKGNNNIEQSQPVGDKQ